MSADDTWSAALALLAQPGARAQAAAPTGLFTDMPPELDELTPDRMVGKTALDVVVHEDRVPVIESWERAREQAVTSLVVRLLEPADHPAVRLTFFDLQDRLGIYLCVHVPTEETVQRAAPTAEPSGEGPVVPRFARVLKSQLARFTEVDDATTQLLGWSREELVGERSLQFVHPDDQDLAVASWLELLGAPGMGRRIRLRHIRKDGSYAWFEVTNYNFLEDPERGYVSCEIVDISEEMAAHEAARAREQLLQRLAEALPVGVIQLSADGVVVYSNSQLSGLLSTEVATFADVVAAVSEPDRDRARSAFAAVLGGLESAEAEVQLVAGDRRYCSVAVRRLDDGAGTTTGAVVCLSDITDSTRLRQELRHRATVDPLTSVLNRAGIHDTLNQVWQAPGAGVAVLFIDLDGFKAINDELGHEAGDRLLVTVAESLRRACRATDALGRLGGDEFLVVCGDLGEQEAGAVQERLRGALERTRMALPTGHVQAQASVGLAWTAAHGTNPTDLVAQADAAMYTAKAERHRQQAGGGAIPIQRSARSSTG
jgi:diguanylate cyclase (GGDEF)-like protein/PAS domain S-box-containing protein